MEVRGEFDPDDGANQSTGVGRPRRSLERKDYKEEEDDSLVENNSDSNGDGNGGSNSDVLDYEDDSNSPTEKNQDEEVADSDDNANVPLKDLNEHQLRKRCKALELKSGGTKKQLIQRIQNNGVSGGNDNDNNDSSDANDYLYTYDHNGQRLWPRILNTKLDPKEFVRRMTIIGDDPNLQNLVHGAPWETAFPDQGRTVKTWYKNLSKQTIVRTEREFLLEYIQYCDLSLRQIGEGVQQYNRFCIDNNGTTLPLPSNGSEALEALYKARNYKDYILARAIYEIKRAKLSTNSENRKSIAEKAMQLLKSEYSLIERRDGHCKLDIGVQYLKYCGVDVPDTMREKRPEVDRFLEDVSEERNHTYAAEKRSSQLVVGLQRQMNEKAVELGPNVLEAIDKTYCAGYNAMIDILRITSPIEEGIFGKHDLTLDHNGQMAVWAKALYGGKCPSENSFDGLTREICTCYGIDWLAVKQMASEWRAKKMDWASFNDDLSGGRKSVVDEINGRCSIDLMRVDDHKKKDCRNSSNDQSDCRTWNRDMRDQLKLSVGKCALSGKPYEKDDLGAISAHHPCERGPLRVVQESLSRAMLLDMKKESVLSGMNVTTDRCEREGQTKRFAREDAVTEFVWESSHKIWHHKVENGRFDIGGLLYHVVNGVSIVDADVQQEFREIFDLCGAASDSGLDIKVRMANAKPISIVPLVFDTSKVSQQHQSVAEALFKMSKAALDDFIGHLSMKSPAALTETEEQVDICIDLVSNKILDRLCEANRQADDSGDDPTTAPNESNDTNNPPSASTSTDSTSIAPAPKHLLTITAADGFVVLVSNEGVPFQLERSIAVKLSPFIANAIKGESSNTGVVSCRHITTATLEICVMFCKRQQTHSLTVFESALESCDIFTLVDSWYLGFVSSFGRNQFWHLMMAAKILGIKPLFDLLCAAFASAVNGKTPDEVRQILDSKDDTPLVSAGTDDSHYAYKWKLGKSGGRKKSKNLGKSTLRKTNMSARREVSQEGSLSTSSGEDLRDEDDGTSGFNGGETDDSGASTSTSEGDVAISAGSGDLLEERNVDGGGEDASSTAGDSELIDDGVGVMEEVESTHSVMGGESNGRDNSADADADGKENAVNMRKIRKRDELDTGEDCSDVEDRTVKRQKSTHNVPAQPIDESRASVANALQPPAQHIDKSRAVANANGVQQDESRASTSIISGLYRLTTDPSLFRYRPLRHIANPTAIRPVSELRQLRHNPLNPMTAPLQNRQGRGFVSPMLPNHRLNNN